jgi:hypothetical protein
MLEARLAVLPCRSLDRLSERERGRISLLHGSLLYRDRRIAGFEAAAVEVVEHLDPPRLIGSRLSVLDCSFGDG